MKTCDVCKGTNQGKDALVEGDITSVFIGTTICATGNEHPIKCNLCYKCLMQENAIIAIEWKYL